MSNTDPSQKLNNRINAAADEIIRQVNEIRASAGNPSPTPGAPAPSNPTNPANDTVAPAWFTAGMAPVQQQLGDHEERITVLEKNSKFNVRLFGWLFGVIAVCLTTLAFIVLFVAVHNPWMNALIGALAIGLGVAALFAVPCGALFRQKVAPSATQS